MSGRSSASGVTRPDRSGCAPAARGSTVDAPFLGATLTRALVGLMLGLALGPKDVVQRAIIASQARPRSGPSASLLGLPLAADKQGQARGPVGVTVGPGRRARCADGVPREPPMAAPDRT